MVEWRQYVAEEKERRLVAIIQEENLNCDHLAMQQLHATLIREGTCVTSDCCDYCIVGDQNPLATQYQLVKQENGLLVSVKK